MRLTLASYFRSSAAYRVRIALALKRVSYDVLPVHLLNQGGEQFNSQFLSINPEARVPALLWQDIDQHQHVLTQSLAIIEYLDETYPDPMLLPGDALQRAKIRAFSQVIACDIHPLNNLSVLQYLKTYCHQDDDATLLWMQHWMRRGFDILEKRLGESSMSQFCFGDMPTLADCCLIPQVFNALRFKFDMARYSKIMAVYDQAIVCPEFLMAAPEAQIDCPFHILPI